MFRVLLEVVSPDNVYVAWVNDKLQVWHERLCHQNKRHVQMFIKIQRKKGTLSLIRMTLVVTLKFIFFARNQN